MTLKIVDTHCHLEESEFDSDLDAVINRAQAAGVMMITSALRPSSWDKALEITRKYSSIYLAAGLDPMAPHDVEKASIWISQVRDDLVAVILPKYKERIYDY